MKTQLKLIEEKEERNKLLNFCKSLTAFTMADRRSSRFHILSCALAFTMAEILISLTIIGVIAAITLPALQANINEKTWATQRKALYSRMSQAISMMDSLNGYGIGATDNETAEKATQAFISDGLSKVLKINNICDYENLKKCGFPDNFRRMGKGGSTMATPTTIGGLNTYFSTSTGNVEYYQINTNAAAFETVNGESVLTFYNPNCSYTYGINGKNNQQNLMQPMMCANFIFDLNGRKGPNQVGKDIGFITAFYPTDSEIVMPYPTEAAIVYKDQNPTYSIGLSNLECRKKYGNDTRMANIEELKSIFVNNTLGYTRGSLYPFMFLPPDTFISSTILNGYLYTFIANQGSISTQSINVYGYHSSGDYNRFFCVK